MKKILPISLLLILILSCQESERPDTTFLSPEYASSVDHIKAGIDMIDSAGMGYGLSMNSHFKVTEKISYLQYKMYLNRKPGDDNDPFCGLLFQDIRERIKQEILNLHKFDTLELFAIYGDDTICELKEAIEKKED